MALPKKYTYKPLPSCLTINNSIIEGLGLFATCDMPKPIILGKSHIMIEKHLERTPLGAFINHSDTPNAEIVFFKEVSMCRLYALKTLVPISDGEEITVDYNNSICGAY